MKKNKEVWMRLYVALIVANHARAEDLNQYAIAADIAYRLYEIRFGEEEEEERNGKSENLA